MTRATRQPRPRCYHPVSGRSKVCYRSKAKAERARILLGNKPQMGGPTLAPMRVYACKHCGYYHLTKRT